MKIWILSTLTFASLIHTIDAAVAFLSTGQPQLPKMYPFIGEYLTQIPTDFYLYGSIAFTMATWGLTCLIAFNSPLEAFLNRTLTDMQMQTERDEQVLEDKSDFFDSMYESMEESRRELGQTYDLVRNLRVEVKDIQKMKETFEKIRTELSGLKKEIRILEEKMIFPLLCKTCRKPLRADFRLCPYCGGEIDIHQVYVAK
jgi:hypothetical protein